MDRYFLPPELPRPRPVVIPVFIPFAGCPQRCVYCAQHLQTRQNPVKHLAQIKHSLNAALTGAEAAGHTFAELAFYGGTFTMLPETWQADLLGLLQTWRDSGLIGAVRLSTRPDAVSPATLRNLKAWGVSCIELGVQTFADTALQESGRSYTGQTALEACRRVQEQDFSLGVQLLPGLPGLTPEQFLSDVSVCERLKPELLRLYPCLVLRGTALARAWENGVYAPWGLEETIAKLAEAQLRCWQAGIRVSRMGLSLNDGLQADILAGPVHPALGGLVRSLALLEWVKEKIRETPGRVQGLVAPRAWQGVFWGHQGNLKQAYGNLGLNGENVEFRDWPLFRMSTNAW